LEVFLAKNNLSFMNQREKELRIMMLEVELKNIKIILQLQKDTLSEKDVDYFLDKMLKVTAEIAILKQV
jgi:hypothetical protein